MAINSNSFAIHGSPDAALYSAQISMGVHRTGKHWVIYLKPLARLVLFLLILNLGVLFFPSSFFFELAGLLVIVALVATFFSLAVIWVAAQCTRYILSPHSIQLKTGLTQISVFELSCSNIASVEVFQTLAGRFFDYGSIKITGNSGSCKSLTFVSNPMLFMAYANRNN